MMHTLTQLQQAQLLAIARSTAQVAIAKLSQQTTPQPEIAGEYGGAFVTLWVADKLRGCVGSFAMTTDIMLTIRDITLSSLKDKRFADRRISIDDWHQLVIEISILSPLSRVAGPSGIVIGKHGIVVRKGKRQGCFLPKVAVERNWDAETFLTQACSLKASLTPKAWLEPDTEIFTFTAQVFSESNPCDTGDAFP